LLTTSGTMVSIPEDASWRRSAREWMPEEHPRRVSGLAGDNFGVLRRGVVGQKLPRVTAAEALQALKRAGWRELRSSGSHIQLGHPERPEARVTIAYHAAVTLHPKTLKTILHQAGLSVEDFRELL
jgi:predicted RNA binding protein YcfA (HicA-like mRNA interferase family)